MLVNLLSRYAIILDQAINTRLASGLIYMIQPFLQRNVLAQQKKPHDPNILSWQSHAIIRHGNCQTHGQYDATKQPSPRD